MYRRKNNYITKNVWDALTDVPAKKETLVCVSTPGTISARAYPTHRQAISHLNVWSHIYPACIRSGSIVTTSIIQSN